MTHPETRRKCRGRYTVRPSSFHGSEIKKNVRCQKGILKTLKIVWTAVFTALCMAGVRKLLIKDTTIHMYIIKSVLRQKVGNLRFFLSIFFKTII